MTTRATASGDLCSQDDGPAEDQLKEALAVGTVLRTTLVSLLVMAGAAGFLLLVPIATIALLGHWPTDEERRILLLVVPVGGVALFCYLRMQGRINRFARRVVYGNSSSPDDLLESMKVWVHERLPLEDLLLHVGSSLRHELSLTVAEIWTLSGGRLERRWSSPERGFTSVPLAEVEERALVGAEVSGRARLRMWMPAVLDGRTFGPLRAASVTHSGRLQGILLAERAQGGEPFDVADERVLVEVARQLGLVLALEASFDDLRRHAEELRHSRARLVAAADEARRQIEKDLHDGAQNRLIVILGTLQEAADKFQEDSEPEVRVLIEEAHKALEDSIQELRDLAHGVYPPVLADRGLAEALRSTSRRMRLGVDVGTTGVERLPVELEAAAYFCCVEALQNVKKHAGERATATVQLRMQPGKLVFTVADDGRGFDPATSGRGAGMTNMRDRLEAVGGRLSVEASPGRGCTIHGEIPLPLDT